MPLPTTDAPFTGGFVPGGRIFARDGDFTVFLPCSAPEIYNPFPGDSVPSVFPIILLDRSVDPPVYASVPVGSGFNQQNFAASQAALIIEQEFEVAEAFYVPLPLNTPYDLAWSIGWGNTYQNLENCFLVEAGPLISGGGELARVKLKFASLPPNRNEFESFNVQFPPLDYGGVTNRFGFSKIVNSRVFYEFFVFDNLNLLPGIPLFPGGHRINTDILGADSQYLTFDLTQYFKAGVPSVRNSNVLDPGQPITDGPPGTTPDFTTYNSWRFSSEIVVEASSFNRWLGNIHIRKTRFALAE